MTEPAVQSSPDYNDCLLQLCKAGSDLLRLRVLRVLSRDAYSVQELCRILETSQPGMSHHLKILAGAGLVVTRREGNTIFYRRAYQPLLPALEPLHAGLLESADALALETGCKKRIAAVHRERAKRSEAFFAEHAGEFRAQQEQVAGYELYGSTTLELLRDGRPGGGDLAVEIGPGEGAFLGELSPHYGRVIALDTAEAMLKRARTFAAQQKLNNVEFVRGDTRHKAVRNVRADCVVINMVLHHVPSPADIFKDAATMLREGGLLSVTELCSHDQNWVREACGDLWLGFDPDDLGQWAAAAGLREGPSAYLAQRNGFRVQVRQFLKPVGRLSKRP